MVAEVTVMKVAEDAVEDETRNTLARPIQRRSFFVPILELTYFTMDINLRQIKCEPHGRKLCSMLVPIMDNTSAMNCKTRHP
jgi:hypothetical protein